MSTLLLVFNSPLQSWGTTLKLKNHDTEPYPSKSGVIGMIAASLGRRRDEDISDLVRIRFGVRIDKQGTVIDDFQVSEIPGKNGNSDKKIGHRKYLSDASFTCGLEGEDEVLEKIKYALMHPAYALFAGRRGCPVTVDLVQGIVQKSLLDALSDDIAEEQKTIILDSNEGYGGAVKDVPVSFSPYDRQYSYRFIEIR